MHTVVVVNQGDEVAGRYRLEELQGRGPMSEVWRAHDSTLDRTVALKILSPTADLGRFRREAQAAATLAHENVMRVYDYGEGEAGPFIALEWLPGGSLEDRLGTEPLPPDETRRVAQGIAAGLAHLHARGLVHRDLKPANVMFDEEDRPKLADFGLARSAAGAGTLTEAGTVLGTAAYISPEQAAGEPAGAASDVYSFGVILFRMLTGALPFVADDALALVNMHRNAPPPAVESLQPNAPPDLAALTAAALRKDPAQRPADGAALLAALGTTASTAVIPTDTEATRVLAAPAPAPVPAPPPPPPSDRAPEVGHHRGGRRAPRGRRRDPRLGRDTVRDERAGLDERRDRPTRTHDAHDAAGHDHPGTTTATTQTQPTTTARRQPRPATTRGRRCRRPPRFPPRRRRRRSRPSPRRRPDATTVGLGTTTSPTVTP